MDDFQRAWLNWYCATLGLFFAGCELWLRNLPTSTPPGLRAIEDVETRGLCRVITARFKA